MHSEVWRKIWNSLWLPPGKGLGDCMLSKSDRLRMLCAILGMGREELVTVLAARRGTPPSKQREQVRAWWEHRHQPMKELKDIIDVLQSKADSAGHKLKVGEVWHADLTPAGFAERCKASIHDLAGVVSDTCRRTIYEQIDALPYLRLMRAEHHDGGQRVQFLLRQLQGTYFAYRVHSSERRLCREIVSVAPQPDTLWCKARYTQYAEGNRQRVIDLSLFLADRWLHAVGAYRDDRPDGSARTSMIHATMFNAPYRECLFAGILLDITDNETTVAAQRLLLRKVGNGVIAESVRARVIENDGSRLYRQYKGFLGREDRDDAFLLTADQARMTRMLEGDA